MRTLSDETKDDRRSTTNKTTTYGTIPDGMGHRVMGGRWLHQRLSINLTVDDSLVG